MPTSLLPGWLRARAVTLPTSKDEEQVPLRALDDDEPPDHRSPPSTRAPSSRTTRYLVLAASAVLVYSALSYLYSDPERWEAPLADRLFGERARLLPTVVRAAGQKWQGSRAGEEEFNSFLGIPYAEAPVGQLRFRTARPAHVFPRLAADWDTLEPINATLAEDGCPRMDPFNGTGERFIGTEDCLKLSIHTPRRKKPSQKLPVMVWIHGGGLYAGAGNEDQYSPNELMRRSQSMRRPFVFVAINYRLGTLGFSASPPLPGPPPMPPHIPTRPPEHMDLNVGFKDQLEALRWIHREIESFGGDKTKITLVGHSAGAISVGLHQLYSPPHLFRGAFMLSGAPTSFPVPWPHDASQRTLHPLPGPAGCPSPVAVGNGAPPSNTLLIECLRSLPLERLMQASKTLLDLSPKNGYFSWYPVYEGDFEGSWLNARPSDVIVRGTFAKVPVVLGSVIDEGTRFTESNVASQDDVANIIRGMFSFTYGAIETIITPIWELYPDDPAVGSPYGAPDELFGLAPSYKRAASLIGDILFQAPRRHFLRETPKDFGEPSWSFLYDEKRAEAEPRMGVGHSADLKLWFDHPPVPDTQLIHLSRHMSSYLINFISNLDPNGPGLHMWPQYGMDRKILHLARHNLSVRHDDARIEAMRFLNTNNPIFSR